MRKFLFVGICFFLFALVILLDRFYTWPPATSEDIIIIISFISLLITMNYALSIRFVRYNIFKDYRNLATMPLIPRQVFLRELITYLVKPPNILLGLSSYLFLLYFLWQNNSLSIFDYSVSFFLYLLFFSYNLIVIRFLFGHSSKGANDFFIFCLFVNSILMLQILLAENDVQSIFSTIIVKYNPLNTLFFITVTDKISLVYLVIIYLILFIIVYPFLRLSSWERHLVSI